MRYSTQEAFEKYRDNIYAIAFNYFRNRQDAEDAVQEVFLKYHRAGKDFDSADHIRNWLIRVSINECKNVTLSSWFKKRSLWQSTNRLSALRSLKKAACLKA